MKRTLLLFSLLLCSVVHVVAQPQVEKYTHKFDDGKYYDEVGYSSESLGLYTWKVEGATNASVAKCDIFLRHFNYYLHTLLYFRFVSINKNQFTEPVKRVELLLTNGERLNFEANNLNKTSYIAFTFEPYHNFLRRTLYTSSFRKFPTINRNDYSDEGLESWDKLEIESSWYLYNQLALYDIKQMIIDKKITLSPLFRSSDFFKPLIAELRSSLDDKSPLPDINNLDRSWARKEINVKVESDSRYGDRVTWDDYIATTTDPKIDFRFSLLPRGNRAIIDFFSLGYSIPDWLSYTDKFSPMTITLANGVQYRTTKAVLQPTLTSRRVNIRVGAEDFVDVRNPSVKMAPKTMLQQLAKYDVVEVKFLKHTIDLRNADGSTAKLFGEMCKALLEKTGVADLYALNTPAPAVRPTTTTSKKTTTAKPTASATKTYKVGDYYADDTTKGFVFQVSEDGLSGKIISLKQADLPWYQGPQKEKPRKMGLENEKFGLLNLVKLRHNEGWHEHFPAFAWCADLGNGWYLPATGELEEIAKQSKVLNEAMLRFPGAHGLSGVYWASNEDGLHEERAWATPHYGGSSSMPKSNVQHVRAVACFNVDATAASSKPVQKTTSSAQPQPVTKPTSTTTKSDAEAIAEADRRAVELMKQAQNKSAKKPTTTSNEEPKGVLLPAFNKLKYGRYIARYDHIAPAQLMNTPLALFTSRAIPMDALLEMMDGAKGVGAAKVSETTTGKLVTVQPTEFYCRLRGYEDMPCATMSVGYDANDAQQIKTATFIYNLPASWKRSKVKEYAKAFSEDMHRLGMRWSEEKDQYVGSHEGHFITIAYGSKSDDNHIYVYIRYAEEK